MHELSILVLFLLASASVHAQSMVKVTDAQYQPTDAILRVSATCVCGSDFWPYRGISPFPQPTPMGTRKSAAPSPR